MPLGTVAAAIARGKGRSGVLDAPFMSGWQSAYNKGLDLRWADGDAATPYFATVDRSMQPIGPGVWADASSPEKTYFMLGLRMNNKTPLPLPIHNPDVVLGGEPGTGRGGLAFTCSWDQPAVQQGSFQQDKVVLLAPGDTSDALVCETPPTGAHWKGELMNATTTPQANAPPPLLISHDFDSATRRRFVELGQGDLASHSKEWRLRMQVAQQEVGRQWLAAELPLEAQSLKNGRSAPTLAGQTR